MVEPYDNTGIITVRVGPNTKAALSELSDILKSETGQPSVNSAIAFMLRRFCETHRNELSARAKFNLLFDQMPRSGQK